jgi:hypothetical protein
MLVKSDTTRKCKVFRQKFKFWFILWANHYELLRNMLFLKIVRFPDDFPAFLRFLGVAMGHFTWLER